MITFQMEFMNHFLSDQDVILVPSYIKRIFLNGEFKNKGILKLRMVKN